MPEAANYKQVLKHFERSSQPVQRCFPHFTELAKNYPLWVSLPYVFARMEGVQHMTLYCGLVKLHETDSQLTRRQIDGGRMTRERFRKLFKVIFGQPIPQSLQDKLSKAEKIRDKIIHGKECSNKEARAALIDIFDFANDFNAFVKNMAGFEPFGDLRGFKGRRPPLSKRTSAWVLKGMGITTPATEDLASSE